MRFVRVGPMGSEIPGVILPGEDHARDLSGITADIDGGFLSALAELRPRIEAGDLPPLERAGTRFGPPIARPHAVYAIGLNYRPHAEETQLELPTEPLVFSKAPNSLCGPEDDVVLPPGSEQGDWEVELGVVIGSPAYLLPDETAADAVVAGYVASNDVSERGWQFDRGGQWMKGKSFPTANPLGPYLVTPDEVPDPQALALTLAVDGLTRQSSNTANMVFGIRHLVWYLSQFVRLEPGDLINTGTPEGVAMGMVKPVYLTDGDEITLEIAGIGRHRNRVTIPARP